MAPGPEDVPDDARVNDPAFWSERYASGVLPWDLGQPSPPLVRLLSTLDVAAFPRVLVPGAGNGYDAIFAARRGHRVVAVDFARAPVDRLGALAEPRLTAVQGDLFALPPEAAGPHDIVVEHTCFCAVEPARRAEYVRVVASALRPGGVLAAVFFTHGRPGGPPWTTDADEIRTLFGEAFNVAGLEIPADSVPDRRGQETLAALERRG